MEPSGLAPPERHPLSTPQTPCPGPTSPSTILSSRAATIDASQPPGLGIPPPTDVRWRLCFVPSKQPGRRQSRGQGRALTSWIRWWSVVTGPDPASGPDWYLQRHRPELVTSSSNNASSPTPPIPGGRDEVAPTEDGEL